MLDVSSRLADDKRNDIRIEAALAKLYGSELGWKVIDELMQVRGGRGYETAESLKARGEKPVPVEQALRDMRINRIFEGSTRDHAPADRPRGGRPAPPGRGRDARGRTATLKAKADAAMKAGEVLRASGCRSWPSARARSPRSYDEFGALAAHLRYVERASRKLARSTFYAMARWQAKLEKQAGLPRAHRRHRRRAVRDLRRPSSTPTPIGREQPEREEEAIELADLFCSQARRRADALFHELWANDDDAGYSAAQKVLDGPLQRGSRRASSTRPATAR